MQTSWIGFAVGFFLGGVIGVTLTCIMVISKTDEENCK